MFKSADPDYFISHVDVTRIDEYRVEGGVATGGGAIALSFRHLSASRVRHHRADRGSRTRRRERVRAGLRHALCRARVSDFLSVRARASANPRAGGGVQHLVRLLGRARALEVMLSAEDYDVESAEQYVWITARCPPTRSAVSSARSLIGSPDFWPPVQVAVKDRVNAIALAPADDFRRDSDLFGESVRKPEAQSRIRAAMHPRLPDPRRGNGAGPDAGRPG